MTDKTEKIRALNDELRTAYRDPAAPRDVRNGRIVFAGDLAQEEGLMKAIVLAKAATFDDFNEENDPHGEHDCASFAIGKNTFMFKIDYYALDEEHGAEHPEDLHSTMRIMTLMYARDY